MLKEFKQFAMRGNMIDLAVGLMLGAAFGAVVGSLVKDVLTPPIGKLIGGVDFSDLFLVLGAATYPSLKTARDAGAATINYGVFVNTFLNFVLVALALFVVVKGVNRLQAQPVPAASTERECPQCTKLIAIRAKRCPYCTSAV